MVRKQDKPLQQIFNRYNDRCLKLDNNVNEDNKITPIIKMIQKMIKKGRYLMELVFHSIEF